jgi:hypothetical protein
LELKFPATEHVDYVRTHQKPDQTRPMILQDIQPQNISGITRDRRAIPFWMNIGLLLELRSRVEHRLRIIKEIRGQIPKLVDGVEDLEHPSSRRCND